VFNRPPFSPDISLDALYHNVNKAWYTQYYNQSFCNHDIRMNDWSTGYDQQKELQLQLTCAPCIRSIQVISITGGEIDNHVFAEVSNLYEVAAHPRNATLMSTKKDTTAPKLVTLSVMYQVKDYVRSFFPKTLPKVAGLSKWFSFVSFSSTNATNTNTNQTVNTNDTAADAPVNTTISTTTCNATTPATPANEENVTVNESTSSKIHPNSPYAYLTPDIWKHTISPHVEPKQITLRTSQIVGYPIDHYAILWCYDLVDKVNTGLKALIRNNANNNKHATEQHIVLYELFGGQNSSYLYQVMEEVNGLEINQLSHFVTRNASNRLFLDSKKEDIHYMKTQLEGNTIWYLAVDYFSHHILAILPYFYVWSLLALATLIGNELLGRSFSPVNDLCYGINFGVYEDVLVGLKPYLTMSNAVVVVVVAITAAYNLSYKIAFSTGIDTLFHCAFGLISLLVALGIRGGCLSLLWIVQWFLHKVVRFIGFRSSSSKRNHSSSSDSPSFVGKSITLVKNHFLELLFLSMWIAFVVIGKLKQPNAEHWSLASVGFTLAIYLIVIVEYILMLGQYFIQSKKRQYSFAHLIRQELVVAYGGVLLAAWPHFHFIIQFVLTENQAPIWIMNAKVFNIFFSGDVNYNLCLLSIALHMRSIIFNP